VKSGHLADSVRAAWLKCSGLFLRYVVDVPKHLAGACKVKTTFGPQLPERRQHVVRAVDVHIHRGKPVREAFRHETLCREVVALVKIMVAENVKNAGITLEAGRM